MPFTQSVSALHGVAGSQQSAPDGMMVIGVGDEFG